MAFLKTINTLSNYTHIQIYSIGHECLKVRDHLSIFESPQPSTGLAQI